MKIHKLPRPFCALLFFFLFALVGCNRDKKRFVIGVSQCSQDEWRNKMNMEMQHELLLYPEAELVIKSVLDDTEKQTQDIEKFIEEGVDLLIITPNKAAPLTPVIEKAHYIGIPVVLVDRKILSDKYTAFVGADNYQIGKEVGDYIVSLLNGKGNILEIQGLEGSTSALERHQGFFSVISNYPGIKLVAKEDGAWLKDVAESKMEKVLSDNIPVDVVYAQNDRMAKGAYSATQKINANGTNIKFIGIDGLPREDEGIDLVHKGILEATFLYPTGGDKVIQIAMSILNKEPYDKNTVLNTALIDKSNARILKLQTTEIASLQEKMGLLNKQINNYLDRYAIQRNILYLICCIVVLSVILLLWIFTSYRSKNRLNKELSDRNLEINEQNKILEGQKKQLIHLSEKLEEATHTKLVFFTNISHEFRTPLTLISGPLETLLNDSGLSSEQKRLLFLMRKNITILLNLIDQIIEFRKVETGKFNLKIAKHNLSNYLNDWNNSFRELSLSKDIDFSFQQSAPDFIMDIDLEKIERIYFNLLSNALKFTPKGGYIHVSLSTVGQNKEQRALLTVANRGKGLTREEIQNIFERFYQVDSHVAGAGIGLALTKSYVELHGGTISAESNNDQIAFNVSIPIINNRTVDDNQINNIIYSNDTFIGQEYIHNSLEDKKPSSEDRIKILIIDDNEDIRHYLDSILSANNYEVIVAEDGKEGLEKALNLPVDIVISDVIMPKIDGITLCRKLKEDPTTCHIPVVLLTASSQDEERIKGFESGADAYIPKPFNPNMLVVRVRKILENRSRLINYFNHHLTLSEERAAIDSELVINPMDEKLINKFNQYIFDHITQTDLNVEDIARELGFSRVQLYRKLKAITNQSPNELIRHIRLRFSQELLKQGKSITEIAYMSGFTSVSYYSKCFKDFFNETPTQYQDKYLK